MKKSLLLFAALLIFNYSKAQNTFPASGNVGIGTTNPTSLLHIASANNIDLKLFSSAPGGYSRLFFSAGTNGARWNVGQRDDIGGIFSIEGDSNGGGAWGSRLAINLAGNVGIGTTNPLYHFQVQKISSSPALMIGGGFSGSPRLQIYGLDADANAWMGMGSDMGGGPYEHSIYFPKGVNGYTGKLTVGDYDGAQFNSRMTVLSNGNVGIGTTQPDQKLTVNGTIHSTQVKIDLNIPGPDYVFKKNYNLPELTEVKNYIDKNHHLSEMPSAAQMEKNGVDLGEMNIKLLKKVEELTLYLIEKDKKDKAMQGEMIAMRRRIKHLETNKREPVAPDSKR